MSMLKRKIFMFYSRPLFRTVEIICNHAARIFENKDSLTCAREDVKELNQKRMQGQRILNRVGRSHGHVCANCKGKCCGGVRERDAFTDRVLQDLDTSHRAARRKTGEMAAYKVMSKEDGGCAVPADAKPVPGHCPELTTKGCKIPYELRPIQCTAYFCTPTVNELSDAECNIGIKALASLMKVQMQTVMLALRSRSKK